MKNFLFFAASLAILASCSKEELVAPSIVQSTIIHGSVMANLDYTNDTTSSGGYQTTYETAPAAVALTVTYDSEDLERHPDPNYDYQEIHMVAELGANGDFSIEVPTIAAGSQVEIRVEDFHYNRKVWDYSTSPATKTTVPHLFQQGTSTSLMVYPDLHEQLTIMVY
ncbi:MAG: hypothetical protein O2862_07955 [Bacteroidetes bacterium]|nr:hypothetical protein [Bacteroidota bacterium]MDA1126855.1 hypothetical protein [Bacteroidota bacterium]